MLQTSAAQQRLYALHSLFIAAGSSSELVVGLLQTVDADGDSAYTHFFKVLGNAVVYECGIAGHAPAEAQLMSSAHDIEELLPEKGLSACDIQHFAACAHVLLYLLKECAVLLHGELLGEHLSAVASAVHTSLVAAQCQLQK